ncbi:MAG TPA: hypothetical protein VI386_33585, partial [Candidatus Sulfotelmatobacter sp.]
MTLTTHMLTSCICMTAAIWMEETAKHSTFPPEAVKKLFFQATGTDTSSLKCFGLPASPASTHLAAPIKGFYAGCAC